MITIPELTSQALGAFLMSETKGRFGSSYASLPELLPYAAKLALECIGNSDALYHNVEHTMLVTLVRHDILIGRALLRPSTGSDYAHFILACLIHDIGYVRGIIHGDQDGVYVVDGTGRTVELPVGSSDAALAPYHVDRSMKKSNALFYEFEETGLNKSLGYATPADVVYKYPQFYWTSVAPQIQTAIRYLNITSSGRQWIGNLYGNVFRAEREVRLSGPQI